MTSRPEIERILRGKERGVSQTDWQRVPPEIPPDGQRRVGEEMEEYKNKPVVAYCVGGYISRSRGEKWEYRPTFCGRGGGEILP